MGTRLGAAMSVELKIPDSGHTVPSPPDKAVLEMALLWGSLLTSKIQAHGTGPCSADLLPGAPGVGL